MDKDIEMLKFQIAAEDVYSELEVGEPMLMGIIVALFVLSLSLIAEHRVDIVVFRSYWATSFS